MIYYKYFFALKSINVFLKMIFLLIISVDYFFGNPVKSNTDNTGIKGNFFDLKKRVNLNL